MVSVGEEFENLACVVCLRSLMKLQSDAGCDCSHLGMETVNPRWLSHMTGKGVLACGQRFRSSQHRAP